MWRWQICRALCQHVVLDVVYSSCPRRLLEPLTFNATLWSSASTQPSRSEPAELSSRPRRVKGGVLLSNRQACSRVLGGKTYLSSHGGWSTLYQTGCSSGFKVGAWEVSRESLKVVRSSLLTARSPTLAGALPSVVYAILAPSPFVLDPNNSGYIRIETAAQMNLVRDKLHLTGRKPLRLRLMLLTAPTSPW